VIRNAAYISMTFRLQLVVRESLTRSSCSLSWVDKCRPTRFSVSERIHVFAPRDLRCHRPCLACSISMLGYEGPRLRLFLITQCSISGIPSFGR
jgi:hypothetical protein